MTIYGILLLLPLGSCRPVFENHQKLLSSGELTNMVSRVRHKRRGDLTPLHIAAICSQAEAVNWCGWGGQSKWQGADF